MQVVLGAWGIGEFAAARSEAWGPKFGKESGRILTLPPMSAIHAGGIELFPLVLCERVFIDANQFELLADRRNLEALNQAGRHIIVPSVADLVREFHRAGVIQPIDFCSLVKSQLHDVVALAEKVLASPDLPGVAARSRALWMQFLLSPGGGFLPDRGGEIANMALHTEDYSGQVPVALFPRLAKVHRPNALLPRAAVLCGHDVFDAAMLLKVGDLLHATVCDWQMYAPIYRHCITTGNLSFRAVNSHPVTAQPVELEWFIPIPKSPDIDEIWRLRDDPELSLLKQQAARVFGAKLTPNTDASTMLEVRRQIAAHFHTSILNSYKSLGSAPDHGVFIERLIEHHFGDHKTVSTDAPAMGRQMVPVDNESKEFILVGELFTLAGKAGQIFRPIPNSDWGIDGEIEFKDHAGKASGKRLYLQLKSGDSYLYQRKSDGVQVFAIANERHAHYWQQQAYPVMLVIRTSDGIIRWMDVSEYLKRESQVGKPVKQVVFTSEVLTASSLRNMRDRFVAS